MHNRKPSRPHSTAQTKRKPTTRQLYELIGSLPVTAVIGEPPRNYNHLPPITKGQTMNETAYELSRRPISPRIRHLWAVLAAGLQQSRPTQGDYGDPQLVGESTYSSIYRATVYTLEVCGASLRLFFHDYHTDSDDPEHLVKVALRFTTRLAFTGTSWKAAEPGDLIYVLQKGERSEKEPIGDSQFKTPDEWAHRLYRKMYNRPVIQQSITGATVRDYLLARMRDSFEAVR